MRYILPLVHYIVIPALVGCIVALSILLWAPDLNSIKSFNNGSPINAPTSYAEAVELAAPTVVNIYTSTLIHRERHPIFDEPLFQYFFGTNPQPDSRIQSSLGSGVIMREDGYVLTNNHVISGADEIVVALRDGREAEAKVVGTDPDSDLALLKIELDNLPAIHLTNNELRIGDVVLAIGNPFGVGQTVTLGIVSATGRGQLGLSIYEDYIQTDAAINPGNSGGALINTEGELVGLNTAIFSKSGGNQGIGFAIPSAIASRIVDDILLHGSAIRGWLGIEVQESTPSLLEALGLPKALTGLIVTAIHPGGPAEKSGLKVGDIITKINQVETEDARKTMNLIAAVRPGEVVDIEYLHGGKVLEAKAVAGQRKQQQQP